jgi:hypothetical protein
MAMALRLTESLAGMAESEKMKDRGKRASLLGQAPPERHWPVQNSRQTNFSML